MELSADQRESLKAAVEAVLFTMGEAVSGERLAAAVGVDEKELNICMEEMQQAYEAGVRGIRLVHLDDSWQLCTKKEYYNTLVRIAHVPKKQVLTDVLLETLAIIAYRQPVTKQEIEKIRGVKSDHAVNKLIEYGLVCEAGRLDAPGRPLMLATTEEFLRRFGVGNTEELPEISPEKLADFRAEALRQADEMYPKGAAFARNANFHGGDELSGEPEASVAIPKDAQEEGKQNDMDI